MPYLVWMRDALKKKTTIFNRCISENCIFTDVFVFRLKTPNTTNCTANTTNCTANSRKLRENCEKYKKCTRSPGKKRKIQKMY